MKKLLIFSIFVFLFSSSLKAQDSSRYYEFHSHIGASSIGINVLNHLGQNFDLPDMGIATHFAGLNFSFGRKKSSIEMSFSGGSKEKSTSNIQL